MVDIFRLKTNGVGLVLTVKTSAFGTTDAPAATPMNCRALRRLIVGFDMMLKVIRNLTFLSLRKCGEYRRIYTFTG